jgi:hypothetical protein
MSSRGERAAGPALPAPADVLLSDGSVAVIRPVVRDDAPQLHRLHEQVSDENYRCRDSGATRNLHASCGHAPASEVP